MRLRVLLGVLLLALPSAALAQPNQPARPHATKPQAAASPAQRNPCAAYGPNFVAVEGTSTCVQIGGRISVGVGTAR